MQRSTMKAATLVFGLCLSFGGAMAQAEKTETEKGIDRYRELIADGNPAELWEMQGEELWKKKAGPKNASLEQCDLGL